MGLKADSDFISGEVLDEIQELMSAIDNQNILRIDTNIIASKFPSIAFHTSRIISEICYLTVLLDQLGIPRKEHR